jgi:PD-(D/E)XK nuclease superfamily
MHPINFKEPWTFTKLDVFRTCKRKFYFQFIQKLPQGSSPAMERGGKLHEEIEAYLQGWSQLVTPGLTDWRDQFDKLRSTNFMAEEALGIDKNWSRLPDWFGPQTWLRVKMDARFTDDQGQTFEVIDFKSGKYRVPSPDQVEVYAIAGLSCYPAATKARASFWFIDADDTYTKEYTKEELIALRPKYERETEVMYGTTVWPEEPSRECKWCPYTKSKGGPCRY